MTYLEFEAEAIAMETPTQRFSPEETRDDAVSKVTGLYNRLKTELHKVIVGQNDIIEFLLTAMFARGHVLLIGVPGLAKTLLVKSLSSTLGWNYKRIQFTPDLMPSDVIGTEILQTDSASGERSMRFVPGPVFTNLLLADEINRTPPKTQSALLEAMQEYAVTIGGRTLEIGHPFFVVATQNPIEQEGTYPLPEAQLDRFMFSLHVDYPHADEEIQIVEETTSSKVADPEVIATREDVIAIQDMVRSVPVSRHVVTYAVDLVRATRPQTITSPPSIKDYVQWGAGPRASQHLILGAKVRALLNGRFAPSCEDIRHVALPVLRHRILPNYHATAEGVRTKDLVDRLLKSVREPANRD